MALQDLEPTALQRAAVKYDIVDADAHIDPPHEMWVDYLPARFKDMAPRIEEGEENDWVVFEGKRRPLMMINNQAGRTGKNFKMLGKLSDLRESRTPASRLAEMDIDGMNAAVLFGGGPLGTMNTELYIESFRAYNRWLADFCSADPRRLSGVAYMPMRDLDETIGLIREAAALGFRTINIPAFPQSADAVRISTATSGAPDVGVNTAQAAALTGDVNSTRLYWQPEFDRLWAEICAHDLSVTMHLGGRVPRFGNKEFFLADLVMSKVAMAEPVAMAIYGGVFDRFPKMRWAIIESGVGWMSWMAEYMDRTWEKQRFWTDSQLKDYPSTYMDRNIWGSFINDRLGVVNRNQPGGRNIMWSSDYPHSETTFPNSYDVIARDFAGVPTAEVQAIVGDIARAFFQVPR
ncbi:amidohydrolase family protein [Novosphingobium bradum]|uniref:Amidohydrolase family protein n=1 Tax=Novosphingobium bradum TaxID=1737444 RepID=A0ABV7IRF8_9SPHN